ncbi:alpha/beta fold hydrolase [Rheinheimera nanhaiensis]|uniref:Alpha/beta hydrolase fold protein n=1 Tax=Rheinheimera nanhaiensis E407-8 TaxID=562729 RepID=I1DTT6_9GAMM|nr:alpha/beta hydrolase [Rheinheimera nanhaiensis]GAB57464.1 alpha/beta hydrolase fold protein [Rheinheimera nanhaiensis E407-8]
MTKFKFRHIAAAVATAALTLSSAAFAAEKPTVVLVHGAFAESSSWNGVAANLLQQGYPVVAVANPLRSLTADADYVASLVKQTSGPVVLVGHSYGGAVISNAVQDNTNVSALVYVAAFAPEQGETVLELSGRYPGSTLGPTLAAPVLLKDGSKDLYIQQDKFAAQFAADVPAAEAVLMAATQRPVTELALTEAAGQPAWHTVPSWAIYGTADKNIPAVAMKFMAQRAKAKKIVEVPGASHVVMTSHPDKVAALIVEAATATSK